MNSYCIPFFPITRWLVGKSVVFALLGLLALDGGLRVTSAFAQSATSFSLSTSTLAYSATVGSPNKSGSVTVTNTGSTALTVTWADSINWLVAITPGVTQTIQPGQSGTFALTASFANLVAGSYSGTATISGGGITKQVPVTLSLTTAGSATGFSLSSATLAYSATVGSPNKSGSVTVTNTGSTALTVIWADSINWLVAITPGVTQTIQPGQSGTFALTASFANLAAGSYSGTATISGGGITKQVPVTLSLTTAGSATGFSLSSATLAYSATVGSPNKSGSVTVTNTGSTALTVTWADSINWLVAITPGVTQTIQPGQSGTFALTASFANLAAGSYSGTATISGGGITKQVPVTLSLTTATSTPAIGLSTTSLGYSGTVGGTNPSAQTIGISNVGSGTLTWTTGDNATWLTLSPLSGTNTGTVTASVNLAGLLSGSYTATVTVTATGATAKTVPVTLTVTGSTGSGTIGFSPANLAFSGTVGGTNPAARSFALTNTGGGTLSWTLSDNATWLQLNTASGTTTTETDTISVGVTTSGLAAGTYNGIIIVTASGASNNPRQIPVSLTLSATVAGTANLTWNANTESDVAGYKVYRGTGSGTYGAPLSTLPKTTTSFTATGLQNGTTYFFAITAYDNAGNESTFSNEVSKSIF